MMIMAQSTINLTLYFQFVTTMGDSLLSPPLAVKTPYNKTDLDEFRDSLGKQSLKFEISSIWQTKMKDAFFLKEKIKTRHDNVRYTFIFNQIQVWTK